MKVVASFLTFYQFVVTFSDFTAVANCLMTTGAKVGCSVHDVYSATVDGVRFFKDKYQFDPVDCLIKDVSSSGTAPPVNPVTPTQPIHPDSLAITKAPLSTKKPLVQTTKAPVLPSGFPPLNYCPGDMFKLISEIFLTRCLTEYSEFYAEAIKNNVIRACR
jgi:hypothetical protein